METRNSKGQLSIEELIESLGDNFYELKRLVNKSEIGGFCAYSTEDRAVGQTAKESLENLKKLLDGKDKGTVA